MNLIKDEKDKHTMAREIIYKAMLQKYEADIADADVKIQILLTTTRIIPEHIDITGEIDKLLGKIEEAESKDGDIEAKIWHKLGKILRHLKCRQGVGAISHFGTDHERRTFDPK